MERCSLCIHIEVCSKYEATGGNVKRCQHFKKEKHGQWLPQILLGQRVWDCSECKTLGSPRWTRCPVCEAIMDRKQ
jgi:hypothetical protein